MNKIFLLLFSLVSLLTLCGCFYEKDDYQVLPDVSELAERSVLTPEELASRRTQLEKIAQEAEPAYLISSGDRFSFHVYDNQELTINDMTVTPDGYLSFILIGPQKVGGMTLDEATRMLEEKYAEYIKYPKVSLNLYIMTSQMATIGGKVMHPGRYPVGNGMRLADLIAMAWSSPVELFDGQGVDLADWESSIFVRNGEILPVDFNAAIMQADPLNNLVMHNGDYVYVSTRSDKIVSVIGEVNQPGLMIWNAGLGMLELISKAKGLKDEHWSNALVIRGGMHNPEIYRVSIDDILAGKAKNVALHPGDIVYVPKDNISEYNVYVNKVMPTAQLFNMVTTPAAWFFRR